MIYNLHGLDDEGWGPIRADYLEAFLVRLVRIENLKVLPVGKALAHYAALLESQVAASADVWCMFDNTASSAAAGDALALMAQA